MLKNIEQAEEITGSESIVSVATLSGPSEASVMAPNTPVGCHSRNDSLVQQAVRPKLKSQKFDTPEFPIDEVVLKNRMGRKGYQMKPDVRGFVEMASQVATGNTIPSRFNVGKPCPSICVSCNSYRTLHFHRRIRDLVMQVLADAAPNHKMSLVGKSELIFAARSYSEAGSSSPDRVLFFAACSGSGRQAHHPAQASFVELVQEKVDGQAEETKTECHMLHVITSYDIYVEQS